MIACTIVIILCLALVGWLNFMFLRERERIVNLLIDAKDSQIRQAGGTIIPSSNQQPRVAVSSLGWFDRKKS